MKRKKIDIRKTKERKVGKLTQNTENMVKCKREDEKMILSPPHNFYQLFCSSFEMKTSQFCEPGKFIYNLWWVIWWGIGWRILVSSSQYHHRCFFHRIVTFEMIPHHSLVTCSLVVYGVDVHMMAALVPECTLVYFRAVSTIPSISFVIDSAVFHVVTRQCL